MTGSARDLLDSFEGVCVRSVVGILYVPRTFYVHIYIYIYVVVSYMALIVLETCMFVVHLS